MRPLSFWAFPFLPHPFPSPNGEGCPKDGVRLKGSGFSLQSFLPQNSGRKGFTLQSLTRHYTIISVCQKTIKQWNRANSLWLFEPALCFPAFNLFLHLNLNSFLCGSLCLLSDTLCDFFCYTEIYRNFSQRTTENN